MSIFWTNSLHCSWLASSLAACNGSTRTVAGGCIEVLLADTLSAYPETTAQRYPGVGGLLK